MIDDSGEIQQPEVPDIQPKKEPDELMELMALTAYEFETNVRFMRANFKYMKRRTEKARILILARRWDLLTNVQLRSHLAAMFEHNPGYKPTKDDIQGFVYIECLDILEAYEFADIASKQALQENDMWSRQLSWYQSQLKMEGIEMSALNLKT